MLKVSEIFGPTIQGEGKSQGKDVVFLRLGLCNLHCVWCDTPYTWNWEGTPFNHPDKFRRKDEIKDMETSKVVWKLVQIGNGTKCLVISGGEPLLQQRGIVQVLRRLEGWWIEIETNATIPPQLDLIDLIHQFNCSPKLQNNGEDPEKYRIRPQAIKSLMATGKANFKFVVSHEDDISEIDKLVNEYAIKEVYIMPEGRTVEELDSHKDLALQICSERGWNYTDRLHIRKWGDVRAR